MRHVVVVVIAVVFWALSILIKQHREKVLVAGVVVISLISGVYSFAHAESILTTRKSFEQTFYSKDYVETGEFVDAFLRVYLKDKTVYVKADKLKIKDAEEKNTYWLYAYYHYHNVVNYLKSINANIIKDEEMNKDAVSESLMGDFENLGYTNDFLRNTMLYTRHDEESGNYLYFLTYYRDMSDTSYIYINSDSLDDDEYVLLWQARSDDDLITEDLYLMGRKYYEEKIKQ